MQNMQNQFPFFSRIRTKLIVSYAAIIVFTILVISIVFFTTSKQIIKRHVLEQDQFLAEQLSVNLVSRLKSMEELQFNQYRYSMLGDMLSNTPLSYTDELIQTRRISECLIRLCYSSIFIEGASVLDNNGSIYNYNNYSITKDSGAITKDKMADTTELAERYGKAVWSIDDHGKLFMHRLLINIYTTRAIGQITIAVNPRYLTGIFEYDLGNKGEHILIFDRDGHYLKSENSGFNKMAPLLFESINQKSSTEFLHNGDQYIISKANISPGGLELFHVLSLRELGIYTRALPFIISLAAIPGINLFAIFTISSNFPL